MVMPPTSIRGRSVHSFVSKKPAQSANKTTSSVLYPHRVDTKMEASKKPSSFAFSVALSRASNMTTHRTQSINRTCDVE